jgi:hypothetical protein
MSKNQDHDFHVIHEECESIDSSVTGQGEMSVSQIITNPEAESEKKQINIAQISLKQVTELVNKQTLKGYKAGYDDGFEYGSQYNNIFSFSLGVSVGITITAVVLMLTNK